VTTRPVPAPRAERLGQTPSVGIGGDPVTAHGSSKAWKLCLAGPEGRSDRDDRARSAASRKEDAAPIPIDAAKKGRKKPMVGE